MKTEVVKSDNGIEAANKPTIITTGVIRPVFIVAGVAIR